MLTRRPWLTAAVLVVVAGAGTGIGLWAASSSDPAAAATSYRLVAASVGNVRETVTTTGTVEPADQDSVDFSAAGRVTSVRVAQGDTVTKGQVLGTIDSASLSASLAQAQATLAADQAKVSDDGSNAITGTQLSADQSAVSAAQGQVDSAQSALDGATLRSPIDGLVAQVNVAVGDQVTGSSGSGANSNSGNSASNGSNASTSADFLVIGTTSWIVDASVDDTQVGSLKSGQQAQFTTDGGTTIYGTISSVGLISTSTSGTASYPVEVKVTGSPAGLHAGATGSLQLIYHQLTNVLTVPTLAVHTTGGSSVVYEMSGSKQVAHTVQTGLSSGGQTQIVSGLSEGDQVVVSIPARTGSTTGNTTNRTRGGNGTFFPGGGLGGGGFVPGGGVFVPGGGASAVKGGN